MDDREKVDREKVIKAIEICYTLGHNCTECPLFPVDDCNDKLMHDALSLLKAQDIPYTNVGAWVSVKDRLPVKSGTYLCYQPKAASICALNTVRWSEVKGWRGKEVGSRIEGIEYWMPLPEPPKEG